MVIWLATMEERMVSPFSTTAAAVSSQEDSMARIRFKPMSRTNVILQNEPNLFGLHDKTLHRNGDGPDAATGAIVEQTTGFPDAAFGGVLGFADIRACRVAGFQ